MPQGDGNTKKKLEETALTTFMWLHVTVFHSTCMMQFCVTIALKCNAYESGVSFYFRTILLKAPPITHEYTKLYPKMYLD